MLYFALVDDGETFDPAIHSREDLVVFRLAISQRETEFARVDMLAWSLRAPLDKQRIFISENGELLFNGEVSRSPRGSVERLITVEAIGRPTDADDRLAALADTLRVKPYWDELFLPSEARNDVSELLIGHGKDLAWSRLTGKVSAVDPLSGATTLAMTPIAGTVRQDPADHAPEAVEMTLEVQWRQLCQQDFELPDELESFSTMTPAAVISAWPKVGASLGDGFRVSESEIAPATSFGKPAIETIEATYPVADDELDPAFIKAGEVVERAEVHEIEASLGIDYRFEMRRIERATVRVSSGVQPLVRSGEVEREELRLNDITQRTSARAWQQATDYEVGDRIVEGRMLYEAAVAHKSGLRRNDDYWRIVGESSYLSSRRISSFFKSSRGREAIEHAVERMRARLRYAARAVHVRCEATMPADRNALNHDCMATITAPDILGGSATGRVVFYELEWDGGRRLARVEIACAAGTGGSDTLNVGAAEGLVRHASGRVDFEIEGDGTEQATAFQELSEIPETKIVITPTPAAATDFEQEISVPISGEVAVPKQIELT